MKKRIWEWILIGSSCKYRFGGTTLIFVLDLQSHLVLTFLKMGQLIGLLFLVENHVLHLVWKIVTQGIGSLAV